MATKIYLALYKGKKSGWAPKAIVARLSDWFTRKLTKGQYSHCEIAIERQEFVSGDYYPITTYDCYSSSIRDGGVRCKQIDVTSNKWDLIPLDRLTEAQVKRFFAQTQGKKYDWLGAIGVIFKSSQHTNRYFCSEWCGRLLGIDESWRFSPNDLAAIIKR